jgi:hypothetical protein
MDRRLLTAALLVLAMLGVLCAGGWRRSPQAGARTLLPASSPSFSSIWMSTMNVEYDGARTRIQTGTFIADQAGDVRVRESEGAMGSSSATSVYDSASQTLTCASIGSDGSVIYRQWVNVSPDAGMRISVVSPFEYSYGAAAVVRAALAERDPDIAVKETVYLGRPAWQGAFVERGMRHTMTVDKATGFPLRSVLADSRAPRTRRSVWRVVDIETDVPVNAETFTLDIPAGAPVENSSAYEHFTTTDKVAAQVGYAPFLPAWLPDGCVLAAASTQPDPWGPYGWIFPYPHPWVDLSRLPDNETHLYYRRGYDWFTVVESPRTGPGNAVPAELDRSRPYAYSTTALHAGAFAGKTARTWMWMGDGAALYVQNGAVAVEISGDLTRSELLAVAASLQQ